MALPRSIHLYFDLNDGCNLDCTMCGNRKQSVRNQRVMPLETFRARLLPSFRHVDDFQFGCQYEPMLLPYYEEAVALLKKNLKPGVRGKSISNGTLLNEARIKALVDSEVFRLASFSIDAASKELYERIRRGAKYRRVLENIRKLSEYRDRQNSSLSVQINFTIMRENVSELPDLIRLASGIGVDFISTHKLFSADYGPIDPDYHRLILECFERAKEAARETGVGFAGQEYESEGATRLQDPETRRRCGFTDSPLNLRLEPTGKIYSPCLKTAGPLGNALRAEIPVILSRAKSQAMLRGFRFPREAICFQCYQYVTDSPDSRNAESPPGLVPLEG